MSIVLIVAAVVLSLLGIVGAIVPGLPGALFSWLALLTLGFSNAADYSLLYLGIYGAVAIVISIIDYVVPIWGTKKMGGTKAGTKGSTWGLIISLFILPLLGITIGPFGIIGILAGPFLGAFLGEKWKGNKESAIRSAFGSFLGFVCGTLVKTAYGIWVFIVILLDIIR
ncbi:MAG: DUF456 domain-containing protein [Bacteroidales bacterium]|nr:DUF456 domain-containing protein [Bacteroidales bacterium]